LKPDTSTTDRTIIQNAFCKAAQHLVELDQSIPFGIYPVVPEVMAWIIENENPELSAALTANGLWEQFTAVLVEYGLLRTFAEKFVVDDTYDPYGWNPFKFRVMYNHLVDALNSQDTPVSQAFIELFDSASEVIADAVDAIDTVYWDDTITPSPLREPAPVPAFDHYETEWTSRLSGYRPTPGRDNLAVAMAWFIDQTSTLDDGRHHNFWQTLDVATVLEWFQRDCSEIATALILENRMEAFRAAAERFVETQRQIEPDWQYLGWYLRAMLFRYAGRTKAVEIIRKVTFAFTKDDQPTPSATDVYAMFCRRLGYRSAGEGTLSCETALSSDSVETIRRDPEADETCYLINRSSLPETLRFHSGERYCLAVRMSEERLPFRDKLKKDNGLDYFFSTYDGKGFRAHLTPNGAFWMDCDTLAPLLRNFRFELPVAYVFDNVVILVVYNYNAFADLPAALSTPARYVPEVQISDGEWTYAATSYTVCLSDGRQLKPSILERVRNLSDGDISPAM
jgi:hypothetical protein